MQGTLSRNLLLAGFSAALVWLVPAAVNVQEPGVHHVRAGASGNNSGSDWTNAFPAFPAMSQVARGDTIYVADGRYDGATVVLDKPTVGTAKIFIKKATAQDHGSSVGWNDSFGDGSADFGPRLSFATDHWEINGQIGQWAPDLPNYVPYGFRFRKSGTATGPIFGCGSSGNPRVDITIRHVEVAYTNTPRQIGAWAEGQDAIAANCERLTISRSWLHDLGRVAIFNRASNMVVEYSVLERSGHAKVAGVKIAGDGEHSEMVAMWADNGGDNHTFRYNVIRDWRSTGGLMIMGGGEVKNLRIYGNVFSTTGYWSDALGDGVNGNGVINGLDVNQTKNAEAYVYNNTFVNMAYGAKILTEGTYVARIAKNNIFYNVGTVMWGQAQHDYNWYWNAGSQSEPNIEFGTGNPFVNLSNRDYRLTTATRPGAALSDLFSTDAGGIRRGADGIWDRGAFEFLGAAGWMPLAPTSVRVIR